MGFAAGEGGGALAEGEVAEAGLDHEFHEGFEAGVEFKEVYGFFEAHFEGFGDIFAVPADIFEFGAVAVAVALFAGDEGIGEEVHFEFDASGALAFFAAAAFGVEGEVAFGEAVYFGFREAGV